MQTFFEYFNGIITFGLLGVILCWIAKSKGFFVLAERKREHLPRVSVKSLVVVFAIYLSMTMLVAPLLATLLKSIYQLLSLGSTTLLAMGVLQMIVLMGIFLMMYLYAIAYDKGLFKKIWKDNSLPHSKPILTDYFTGVMTWVLSFPLVVAVGQIVDMILHYLVGFESYEQVAVRYLKEMLKSPSLLTVALFTILVAAPVIEEFLFRGCLQTFFKRFTSQKGAIFLSAACFALFHYAASQGVGNISLILSLFTFALFLGFIYERQASLFASIGLHMTFNTVSTLRVLLFPDG